MRLLTSPYPILILILLLSFCSCHSSRQTRTDYADSSRIDLDARIAHWNGYGDNQYEQEIYKGGV